MPNYRKDSWTDADVRCPFYISDDKAACSISCEGFGKGVKTVSRFRSRALKDRHMGACCVGEYEKCPVYRCTYASRYAD